MDELEELEKLGHQITIDRQMQCSSASTLAVDGKSTA